MSSRHSLLRHLSTTSRPLRLILYHRSRTSLTTVSPFPCINRGRKRLFRLPISNRTSNLSSRPSTNKSRFRFRTVWPRRATRVNTLTSRSRLRRLRSPISPNGRFTPRRSSQPPTHHKASMGPSNIPYRSLSSSRGITIHTNLIRALACRPLLPRQHLRLSFHPRNQGRLRSTLSRRLHLTRNKQHHRQAKASKPGN